ncbi:MAG: DUF1667 domain-containing protein [Clostridia bacterium]|nr:DUF1667 domain-containing protein [Clostridia bacterium]
MTILTCIRCPRGCQLQVDSDLNVQGAGCPQGISYAREEMTHPERTVTATVRLESSTLRRLPVKTREPVPKDKVPAVISALQRVHVKAPVRMGDVVLKDAADTGVDVVATRSVR